MQQPTHYEILQVSPNADLATITVAYGRLLAEYGSQTATNPEAARRVQEINEAYRVLSDPARRAEYDQTLLERSQPSPYTTATTEGGVPLQSGPALQEAITMPTAPPQQAPFPVWLPAIVGLCVIVALGTLCIGGVTLTEGNLLASVFGPSTPRATLLPTVTSVQTVFSTPNAVQTVTPEVGGGTPEESGTPNIGDTAVPSEVSTPNGEDTLVPTGDVTPTAGDTSFVVSVVMAISTTGDTDNPVGLTDTFPPDATFHAVVTIQNAPPNTRIQAVWYSEDTGSAGPPNTKLDEFTLTTSGTRNLDFILKPDAPWTVGIYRVEVYANGTLAKTARFAVKETSSESIIKSTTLSKAVSPDLFDPISPTNTFSPDDAVLHLVIAIQNAPENTAIKANWYFGQQLLGTTTLNTSGTHNLDFRLKQAQSWPVGNYSVQVFVNSTLDRTLNFTVQ